MECSVFQFANILGNYFITFGTVCSFTEIDFIYDSFIGNILSPCTGREYSLEGYVLHYVVRKRTEFFSEGKLNVRIRPLILQLYSVAALSEIQYKHLTKRGRSVVRCSRFRHLTSLQDALKRNLAFDSFIGVLFEILRFDKLSLSIFASNNFLSKSIFSHYITMWNRHVSLKMLS